jgi:release factor glutamine methyltransferase
MKNPENPADAEKEVYFPREDSILLRDCAQEEVKGNVLEMGSGSGFVLQGISDKINFGIGLDINHSAIRFAEEKSRTQHCSNLYFFKSDLFSFLKDYSVEYYKGRLWISPGKTKPIFDYILFNPPYLPDEEDKQLNSEALHGGEKGTELIERFLLDAFNYLKPQGEILLVLSSIIDKPLKAFLNKHGFSFSKAKETKLFYESLYCYRIKR